jgi:hypothetical protein
MLGAQARRVSGREDTTAAPAVAPRDPTGTVRMHDEPHPGDGRRSEVRAVERARLDEEQDGRLRTLTGLSQLGQLSPELQALRLAYREKDGRATVRPPDPVTVHPVELD